MPPVYTPLIVDTNCFIRLLDWRPRPLLGQTIGTYRFATTEALFKEATTSKRLLDRYPALQDPDIHREFAASTLKYPKRTVKDVADIAEEFRTSANTLLKAYCLREGTGIRRLSQADASLWGYAQHAKAAIATDEWPLRLAAQRLPCDDEGNFIPVLSSVHILYLLEKEGRLTAEQRWNTMRQWKVENECLHREADGEYHALFGELAPDAQSPKR